MKCKPKNIVSMWTNFSDHGTITIELNPDQTWDCKIFPYKVEAKYNNMVLCVDNYTFERFFVEVTDDETAQLHTRG